MIGLPTVERTIIQLARFPGVGKKSAQRMVYHLLRQGREETGQLIDSLERLRDRVRPCGICFNLAEEDLCRICRDPGRLSAHLCIVEEPADLIAIENAGLFKGHYHVLGGQLSPLDGIGPDELHMEELEKRLVRGGITELIIATNPTVAGEATAHYVAQLAKPSVERITRLAYGLPMGGELEYLDESTLYQALAGRRDY
ncbi:MAG: recombination protein RecR [Magnetococcales bacterium]|nr:recombination protein RecR [Magnetococcales bacterium]